MERLTTDTPNGNFETMLNFVHSKDGWAHIYDADGKEVNLIAWALNQCHDRGCDDFQCKTLEEYDEALSSCMMDFMDCPVAMAYCFATQAVHLRSRLKMYEDAMLLEKVKRFAQAEKDGRLVVLLCKPDATAYQWKKGDDIPSMFRLSGVGIDEDGEITYKTYWGETFTPDDFGKIVFLTREEAEAALKKREEADNETETN